MAVRAIRRGGITLGIRFLKRSHFCHISESFHAKRDDILGAGHSLLRLIWSFQKAKTPGILLNAGGLLYNLA